LIERYNDEFLQNLISQSLDRKDRFKPVLHKKPLVGDIVLIKDPMVKSYHYPMAVVTRTYENTLDEVTDVEVYKGKTGETVKRHVSWIIPLLRPENISSKETGEIQPCGQPKEITRPTRRAKKRAKQKIADLARH